MSKYDFYGHDRKLSFVNLILIIIAITAVIVVGTVYMTHINSSQDGTQTVTDTIEQLAK